MEYIASVFMNAINEEREEEFSNWYNYVHLRDVMGMQGAAIACQRFVQSKYQPCGFEAKYKYYTLYEVRDKEVFTQCHMDTKMTWQCLISTAVDFSNFKESYWDNAYGSFPYASYAGYASDNTILVALLCTKNGTSVESIFTPDKVNGLSEMDGIYSANLYRISDHQMPKQTAASETYTHQLILQLQDARDGIISWDAFAKNENLSDLEISIANYTPVMQRLKACDRDETGLDRALSALYHTFTKLPGFGVEVPGMSKQTDVLTPAIQKKLSAINK